MGHRRKPPGVPGTQTAATGPDIPGASMDSPRLCLHEHERLLLHHAAQVARRGGRAGGPGYVIAYSVGRLQIETLLGEYLRRTHGRGSLRDFHDRLLSYGTTPKDHGPEPSHVSQPSPDPGPGRLAEVRSKLAMAEG